MTSSGFSTQRKAPRRRFDRIVGSLFAGQYRLVRSLEIGEGGMLIEAPDGATVGQCLVVTFKVGDSSVTMTRAEIKYINDGESNSRWAGVMFLNLDFAIRRHIRNYVAEKSSVENVTKRSAPRSGEKVG